MSCGISKRIHRSEKYFLEDFFVLIPRNFSQRLASYAASLFSLKFFIIFGWLCKGLVSIYLERWWEAPLRGY